MIENLQERLKRENSVTSKFLFGLWSWVGKTRLAACFCMAHQLRIGYKEEEKGQRAKGAGEERRGGKREREGEEGEEEMWQIICGP